MYQQRPAMTILDSSRRKLVAISLSKIKPLEKTKRYSDGYGLYLEVRPNGSKYWRYNYRFFGKQKTLSLGVYPTVSLGEVRQLHEQAYKLLQTGVDPNDAKKAENLSDSEDAKNTFEAISHEWLNYYMSDKTLGHKERAERMLFKHLARLKNRQISTISAPEILSILRDIESTGTIDTAHRCRATAAQVFAYAIQTGRAYQNPARELVGALKQSTVKHRAAILDPAELGHLLRDIDNTTARPVTKTAMQLTPLLFQRPGEIRAMEWEELDLDKKLWLIPAEKMKMRNAHIVPLSNQSVALLTNLQPLTASSRYVFPSARGKSRCMSDAAVRTAIRDMGYSNDQVTPHGFRATARTLLDEVLGYRVDWIEQQLAHTVKDVNGRAYNRTKHLEQRIEMMQAWADYLDKLKAK